jgi:methyltransferase (TIGR00027 family)
MITRTKLIDDLIAQSLAEGCDRVVNLAAGFDTRPYRLELPATLQWIEADLPAMIDEKERLLSAETPRCRLTRERVDLSDAAARGAFLEKALAGASKALILTEGLLVYLEDEQVRALGRDLARPAVRWWIVDVTAPRIVEMIQKDMGQHLENAPMKFAPANGVAFFEHIGWKARDIRPIFRNAVRFRRVPLLMRLFAIFPDPDPRNPGKAFWSAVVRLER